MAAPASLSLLARLGLRQLNIWDPPTVLDRLLASPTRAAAHWLWTWLAAVRQWRQRLWQVTSSSPMSIRVVCLSDTHDGIVPDVPAGDLLIHAGDLTNCGTPAALQRQLAWIVALPHAHKVVVCGNHDTWFDPVARRVAVAEAWKGEDTEEEEEEEEAAALRQALKGVHYLERTAATLAFTNGRQLKVYGAPDVPRCGGEEFAFQYDRTLPPWKDTVPADTDILVTHPPPRHHRDLGLGCAGLLQEIWRVRPRLHVFGHVHWGAGRELLFWDAAQQAYEALIDGKTVAMAMATTCRSVVLLGRLLAAAVVGTLLLPVPLAASVAGSSSTLLVNAAQMHGNTGHLGRNIQVVDL